MKAYGNILFIECSLKWLLTVCESLIESGYAAVSNTDKVPFLMELVVSKLS